MSSAPTDLRFAEATILVTAIKKHELSPVELLDDILQRADQFQPTLHPFVTLDAENARAQAKQAEDAVTRDQPLGALHGLPVSVKDLESTKGLRTTSGSKFFEIYVPDFDGAVATKLRESGAIIFGKTNTPHFGHKDSCDNLIGPPTRNPWNLERTPGGSSGGSAAAVAAGIGPLAHGSDGAGSIRIPAALCGIFGFKGTLGLVPYWPNPDLWSARSHNGPLARSVKDAALMLNAIARPDPRDPLSYDSGISDWLSVIQDTNLKGLRVAWSADFGYAPVDPEVRQITSHAARVFSDLGAEVEEVDPTWDDPKDWAALLWDFQSAIRNADRAKQHPDWIEPSLMAQIEHGLAATALDLGKAQLARTAFYEQARTFMQQYDLLISPQMPCVAWPLFEPPTQIDGHPTPGLLDHLPFTFPFNMTGWPAATLPCGFNSAGLPVALQVAANLRQDALCLRAAAAFESAHPWSGTRPPLY